MADIDLTTGTVTIGDATFTKTDPVGSGTGLYDPFLATHDSNANGQTNDGVAEGFNSDGTGILDTDASKTSSLKLSDMPIKVIDGVAYYEFRVDLNETNSATGGIVSLNEFKLYTSTSPATLADFNNSTDEFGAGFTKVYDLDAGGDKTLILDDTNSGSGTDDYVVLIKVSAFGDVDPTTTYLTLYTNMGREPTPVEDGGFEEWKTEDVAASITGTKFADTDGDGVKDADEGGLGGVTIFIDTNQNGVLDLDLGERTTVTAADGSYSFFGVGQTEFGADNVLWIDEVTPAGYTQTTGAQETLTWAGEIAYTVDPIGNQPPAPPPTPAIAIDKDFLNVNGNVGEQADSVGDVLNYAVTVTNTGNVTLTGVTVVDPLTGQNISGVTLAPGASQVFNSAYVITQDDLDGAGNAGSDHDIDNTATAASSQTGEQHATASVEVPLVYDPNLAIEKEFENVNGNPGEQANSVGDVINYRVTVENTGNVTLTGVSVVDPLTGQNISGIVLAPGASQSFESSYTITQDDLNGAGNAGADHDIDNVATADSDQTGPGDDSNTVEVPLVYNPTIAIDKEFLNVNGNVGEQADSVGDVLNYAVTVTNTGNVTLTGVTVVDPLTGQNISGVTLAPGASQVFNSAYVITQDDLDGAGNAGSDHDIDNTATAASSQTGEQHATASVEVPLVYDPNLAIEKEFENVNGNPGEQANSVGDVINYRVTVENTGNVTLTGVSVVDPLTGQNISGIVLAPGASQSFESSYTITQDDLNGAGNAGPDHDIDNVATADSDQTGPGDDSNTVEVPLVYNPTIAIDKDFLNVNGNVGEQADSVGDVLNYAVTVTNTGNVTLTGVTVVDPLTGQNISGVTLAPGASQVFNSAYVITQDDLDGAGNAGSDHDIDNTATAASSQTGEQHATASVEVPLVYDPNLAIEKEFENVNGNPGEQANSVGDVINYRVTVENTGNVTLTGVSVVDPLTGQNISGIVLAPGASQSFESSYTITQDDLNGAGNAGADHDIDNVATADSDQTGPGDSNTVEVPLAPGPAIAIDKDFLNVNGNVGEQADSVGDVLNYAVTVTNTGNVTLTGVTVVDPLTGQNISGVTLAPGASQVFNSAYVITQDDLDGAGNAGSDHDIDNTATAASSQTGEQHATASVEVPLVYDPNLAIEKEFENVNGNPGEQANSVGDVINYRVTVENTGNVTLTGVSVVDPLTGQNISGIVLAPGASQSFESSYTITQDDLNGAGNAGADHDIDNVATADSDQTGPGDDSNTVEVPLVYNPTIAIDKEFLNVNGNVGEQADSVGDVLNYAVTVTNTGNVTLTGVTVVDPLTGQNISGVTLAPGASQVFNSAYVITQDDLDGAGNAGSDHDIDNTATAASSQTGEQHATASVEVPLVYDPNLAIEKEFENVNGNPGEQANSVGDVINYRVTVENTGNVTLTGVSVVDPLTGQNISGIVLAPGASQSFESSYTITQDDLNGAGNAGADHDIDNVATADSDQTGPGDSNTVEVPLTPEVVVRAFDGEPRPTWSHDQNSDIIWQDFAGGLGDPLMLMGDGTVTSHLVQFSPWPTGELPFWKMQGTGDFNGDGQSEIIWQHDSNNLASLWIMNETDVLHVGQLGSGGQLPVGEPPVFQYGPFGFDIKAIGDINGDGRDDVISQQTNGDVTLWLMDGDNNTADVIAKAGPHASGALAGWHVKGSGDFDGDGNADIIFQHDNGQAAMWLMDGNANTTFVGAVGPFNPGAEWQIKGVGDFDGDGKDDLIWQHDGGQAAMWLMDGTQTTFVGGVGPFNPGADWQIQGTGDFNDDGMSDILWKSTSSGTVAEWHMDGTQATFVGAVGMSQPGTAPLFTGDFNSGDELDWVVYNKTDSYESVFGVDAHGNLDGDQLLAVLNQPISSNANPANLEVPLAKQAVTALLNATNDADGLVTQDYRFTTSEVIAAVQEAYDDGGFDAQQGADLTGLLAFWNAASAANTGIGAHVAGELHSDDTTPIGTSLSFNGDLGGSFDGNIFQVLATLHPDHGWL